MAVERDPIPQATPQAAAAPGWTPRRTAIILGAAVILFVGTYALAWFTAYRLSLTYLGDANASYDAGSYLNALVGHEEYDRTTGKYIEYGGYMQVERIWADSYAQPVPVEIVQARGRIDEIVYGLLTVDDAEQFVRENAGRNNPYLGMIYLRLGELYEESGNTRDAEDIYASYADSFPDDAEGIARAQANLARLQAAGN